jgi:hypothetical protein
MQSELIAHERNGTCVKKGELKVFRLTSKDAEKRNKDGDR